MSKITILKGKVLKDNKVFIEYLKRDTDEAEPAECSETHNAPPHPDLINAVEKLTVHAILMGEFVLAKKIKSLEDVDAETISAFHVSGFTLSDKKNTETIILTAQKTLTTGKRLGFNTPVEAFDDDSENSYKFIKELEIAIADCRDEFEKYLNGKFKDDGKDTQVELPFGELKAVAEA